MFIIWGSRYILLTIGSGEFLCPQCQLPQKFKHKRYRQFFTLYFIPIFPTGNGDEFIECQQCKGKFVAQAMRLQQVSSTYKSHNPLLVAYLLVGAVILGCCLLGSIQAANEDRDREQIRIAAENTKTTVINNFGSKNFTLCKNIDADVSVWKVSSNARLLAVNNATFYIWDEYHQELPRSARATSKGDLTHVLCLETSTKEYAQDEYVDDDDTVIYTCTRYRRYIDAYVISVESGETTAHRKFKGDVPPECPDSTNRNLTMYGNDPKPDEIFEDLRLG